MNRSIALLLSVYLLGSSVGVGIGRLCQAQDKKTAPIVIDTFEKTAAVGTMARV